jgi:non-specific serine/threonine protein kinase/serine/threonine-protein kinase
VGAIVVGGILNRTRTLRDDRESSSIEEVPTMSDEEHDPPTVEIEETTKKLKSRKDLPQSVPGFRLLQKLGAGGMGEVFEAEQLEPVRRRVALKLIKRGMESKEVLFRFDTERQALALMSHPNIAQVYDAGTTTDGRPYFVMEFIQGVPVTQYCDTNRLTTNERLELFTQICEGVQHAHHKGVIHRDIKPSNVLVKIQDSKPVPKIIDFGVAKAIAQQLTEETPFTAIGEFIGTPDYMSPEQAEMTELDIDTRTDVYSLGVVLYELLVGARPFDAQELRRSGFDEMRRKIRVEEPQRPSVRLSGLGEQSTSAAKNRRSEPSALARQLHGDLDWITMKALEKDRTRRYDSPGGLAADIRRHLRDEPVLASPTSTAYRLTRFVRRHRVGVAAGLLIVLALLAGMVGVTMGLIRSQRAERRASAEAAKASAINAFLLETLGSANPIEGQDRDLTVLEALDASAAKIGAAFIDQPEVRAAVRYTIGLTYLRLGRYVDAERLLRSALESQRAVPNQDLEATVAYQVTLAVTLHDLGRYDEAESLYRDALGAARRTLGEEDTSSIANNLALLLQNRGDYESAEPLFREVLASDRKLLGEEDPNLAISLNNLGNVLRYTGGNQESKRLFREAIAILSSQGNPHKAIVQGNLAAVLCATGEIESAGPLFREAIETASAALGEENSELALIKMKFGACLFRQGRYEEAEAWLLDAHRVMYAAGHQGTQRPVRHLIELYESWGRPEAADRYRELLGNDATEPDPR